MKPLEGRIAVVTGAARGIGLAVTRRLIADGALVAAVDLDGSVLDESLPEAAWRIVLDVTDPMAIARLPAVLGDSASMLVNCAGILDNALVHEMTPDQYRRVLEVNLAGSHRVTSALIPGMKRARFGRIVHIGSRSWLGNLRQANYAASKGGVVGMTRAQALALGPHGITVNAVAPGFIQTRLTDEISASDRERLTTSLPIKRMGTPADVAEAVRYLLDPAAEYVTGQTLIVCGGRSVGALAVR